MGALQNIAAALETKSMHGPRRITSSAFGVMAKERLRRNDHLSITYSAAVDSLAFWHRLYSWVHIIAITEDTRAQAVSTVRRHGVR